MEGSAIEDHVIDSRKLFDLVGPVTFQSNRANDKAGASPASIHVDPEDGERLKRLAKPHIIREKERPQASKMTDTVDLIVVVLDLILDVGLE